MRHFMLLALLCCSPVQAQAPPTLGVNANTVLSGQTAGQNAAAATAAQFRQPEAVFRSLRIAPQAVQNANVSVFSGGAPTVLTEANVANVVSAGSVLIERTGDRITERETPEGVRYALPFAIKHVVFDAQGTPTIGLQYSPDVLRRNPLRYFGDRRAYVATLGVGIWEPAPNGIRDVSERLAVSFSSLSLTAAPADLPFEQLNVFKDVEVTTTDVSEAATLTVRPNFRPESFDVVIPVAQRPTLKVSFSRPSILGLGLGAATANVEVLNVVNPKDFDVAMSFDGGSMSNDGRVLLDANGRGSLTVRSTGFGKGHLRSADQLFAADQGDRIEMTLPWSFVVAVLAGGLLGTLATLLTKTGRKRWARDLTAGVIVGVIVVAGYAVGINLLEIEPSETGGPPGENLAEGLAFVVAALGAVAGPVLLRLKKAE
jgi:hypothetical protein